jgi:hypothetical protein
MPIFTLTPDSYNALQYNLARPTLVQFELRASHPVKSYFMALPEYQLFLQGRPFNYTGGYADARSIQSQTVWLPFAGAWYLVISNPSQHDLVEVNCEVYF